MSSLPTPLALLLADIALLSAAAAGLAALRTLRPLKVADTRAAFGLLEKAIQKYVPDLPQGYTWREAIERLREAGVDANWVEIQGRVAAYEAYRYGGGAPPADGKEEVVSLVMKIRGLSNGKRAKR